MIAITEKILHETLNYTDACSPYTSYLKPELTQWGLGRTRQNRSYPGKIFTCKNPYIPNLNL